MMQELSFANSTPFQRSSFVVPFLSLRPESVRTSVNNQVFNDNCVCMQEQKMQIVHLKAWNWHHLGAHDRPGSEGVTSLKTK